MIECPEMLMIGSAGRNVGKTVFACRSISRLAESGTRVTGVKITTIAGCGDVCPRGGKGCGVCGSLEGDWDVTEEIEPDEGGKDTQRMLAAGADRVLWMRCRKERLSSAAADLVSRLRGGGAVVCESNSARAAIEPGLFLVFRRLGSEEIKLSCREVISAADLEIRFDGEEWNVPPDRVVFEGGGWRVLPEAR